jgi:membrane protein involved in colicin uptake
VSTKSGPDQIAEKKAEDERKEADRIAAEKKKEEEKIAAEKNAAEEKKEQERLAAEKKAEDERLSQQVKIIVKINPNNTNNKYTGGSVPGVDVKQSVGSSSTGNLKVVVGQ